MQFADKSKASQSFQRRGFHEDDLPEIIKVAKECIGFTQAGKDFSKDVLRLEIQGLGIYLLTLVDLLGLYYAETEIQSLNGKETIDKLVEGYIRQKNSIILVVITDLLALKLTKPSFSPPAISYQETHLILRDTWFLFAFPALNPPRPAKSHDSYLPTSLLRITTKKLI